jgi:hypothetical protein
VPSIAIGTKRTNIDSLKKSRPLASADGLPVRTLRAYASIAGHARPTG